MHLVDIDSCPICGSRESREVARGPTIHPRDPTQVAIRECAACAHWWNTPRPSQDDLLRAYAEGSEFVVPRGYGDEVAKAHRPDGAFDRLVFDAIRPEARSYLEIGAGNALLLRKCQARGLDCVAVEPGDWAPADLTVFRSLDLVPASRRFDVIALGDVLEHTCDPRDMLSRVRALSAEGSALVCSFPNSDSVLARWRKSRWRMVRPFGHLHYFSRRSAQLALEATGWIPSSIQALSPNSAWEIARSGHLLVAAAEVFLGRDQWYIAARAGPVARGGSGVLSPGRSSPGSGSPADRTAP